MVVKVGSVELPGNIVLSPMAGVTDAPFREIARQNGADCTVSEMLTNQLSLWNTNKSKLKLEDRWNKGVKVLQIIGTSPEFMSEAAIKCEQIGADILEINMGCPAKKVCNVLAGSALLRDEKLVSDILSTVTKIVSIPVTLKTRLGWDSHSKNIMTVTKIAEDSGVCGITIHGRTRNDLYNGNATYDLIAQVKQSTGLPVFANGDIDSPEKAKHVLEYTKADGIYVGRATLGKPWLFTQIKDYLSTGLYKVIPTSIEIKNIIKNHINYIHEHYPEPLCYRFAIKHIKWYCQSLYTNKKNYLELFDRFRFAKSKEDQLSLIDEIVEHSDH